MINVDFDLFCIESEFSLDKKANTHFINFSSDEENNLKLFYTDDNTFLYYNEIKNIKTKFDGLKDSQLLNMSFMNENNLNAIVLLFENGDLYIIPCKFLEVDYLESYWKKILLCYNEESYEKFISSMENLVKTSIKKYNNANFSNLLCVSKKREDEYHGILRNNFNIFY